MSGTDSVGDVFAPPSEDWVRVSPRLITARRLVLALTLGPVLLVALVLAMVLSAPAWAVALVAVAGLVVGVWAWWLIGRRVRSYGYCERADDLLVTSGILFRRLVIVPYGRMQLVDVARRDGDHAARERFHEIIEPLPRAIRSRPPCRRGRDHRGETQGEEEAGGAANRIGPRAAGTCAVHHSPPPAFSARTR